jgi:serine/threonine-protein kinase
LLDFGVAQLMDGTEDLRSTAGTLAYMAPEQVRGERVTPRTDVYAMTLVLYEMLTGRLPWDVDSSDFDQMIAAHKSLPPIAPSRFAPWIPPRVEALILRGLAKKPADRPVSAYAFAEELYELQFVDESATTSSRVGVVKRTTEPGHATITEWEERERRHDPSSRRGSFVNDTHREMTPPPVEGRSPEVDPYAMTAPAVRPPAPAAPPPLSELSSTPPPVSGKVPWHAAPTKSEGGTSRSLLSVRQHAARNRKRNRVLAVAALLGIGGLVIAQAVAFVLRGPLARQAATAVERGAAAEVRSPEISVPMPQAPASARSAVAPSVAPGAPSVASAASPAPPASTIALPSPPSAVASSASSAQRPPPPRTAPAATRNTMADQL